MKAAISKVSAIYNSQERDGIKPTLEYHPPTYKRITFIWATQSYFFHFWSEHSSFNSIACSSHEPYVAPAAVYDKDLSNNQQSTPNIILKGLNEKNWISIIQIGCGFLRLHQNLFVLITITKNCFEKIKLEINCPFSKKLTTFYPSW